MLESAAAVTRVHVKTRCAHTCVGFLMHFLFGVCEVRVRIAGMRGRVGPCESHRQASTGRAQGFSHRYDANSKQKQFLASGKMLRKAERL